MFGSSILEVAIGLIFIYLFLSLVCTSINEWYASKLNKRGKNLFEGITNLLNDPDFTGLAQQVYNHGMVDGISQEAANPSKLTRLPSYMPARNFSLALMDILGARGVVASAHGDLLAKAEKADEDYERVIAAVPPASPEVVEAKQAAKTARAELESAKSQAEQAYQRAVEAANANSSDDNLRKAVEQTKEAVDKASAAVKMHDARRAAVKAAKTPASATSAAKAKLIEEAAKTLEEALAAGRAFAAKHPDLLGNIQEAVERIPAGHTKESLLVLIGKTKREVTTGEDQIKKFQENLDSWYNDAMDRIGGWYKRWTQKILLCLAFFVVLVANADTVMLIQQLTRDSALRASLVTAAQEAAKPVASTSAPNTPGQSAPLQNEDPIKIVLEKAESLKLPLGWSLTPADPRYIPLGWLLLCPDDPRYIPLKRPDWESLSWLLSKLFGLLVSVFAVSLGAPFWFDTLSKFVNLRSAGTPPGEAKKSAPQPK